MSAGNQTWILGKSSKHSELLGHLSTWHLASLILFYMFLPLLIMSQKILLLCGILETPGLVSKSTFSVSYLSLNLREQSEML